MGATGFRQPQSSRLRTFVGHAKLENPALRRSVFGFLGLLAAFLFVVAPILAETTDAFPSELGEPTLALKIVVSALLLLLIVVAEHVAEQSKETRTTVFRSERDASDRLGEIARTGPKEVKLCEYSAMSVVDLIRALAENSETESIKLLVQHPAKAANDFQKDRILQAVYRLSSTTYWRKGRLAETVSLRVKCYENPASLRGRKFGNKYVAMGWFTHDCRNEDEEAQIWGDDNPLIVAPIRDDDGEKLAEMFDLVFDNLWMVALPLKEVLADPSLENRYKISTRWVAKVSQEDPVLEDRPPR